LCGRYHSAFCQRSWSPVSSLSNPSTQQPNAFPEESTTYTVISGGSTCQAKGEIRVNVQAPIAIELGEDLSICKGGSIELAAETGLVFNWSPANSLSDSTTQTVIAQPDSTTMYVLQVSDQFCSNTDSVTVYVSKKPASAYQDKYAFCAGDSITLSNALSDPSYNYSWFPTSGISNPNISEPLIYPTQNTSYEVIITDGNLCADTVQVVIESVEQIMLHVSMDTVICAGDTVQLQASGGVGYTWFPSTNLSNPNDSVTLAFPTEKC